MSRKGKKDSTVCSAYKCYCGCARDWMPNWRVKRAKTSRVLQFVPHHYSLLLVATPNALTLAPWRTEIGRLTIKQHLVQSKNLKI